MSKNGADMTVFHLSRSQVARPKQKKLHEIDKFEEIVVFLHKWR